MADKTLLLRPARVWTDGAMHDGWSVLVRGNRIAVAGSNVDAGDAQVVDLKGLTLLPGLMDLHSHLFLHPYNETPWDDQVLKESEAYRTVRAVTHAAATLRAGFTTLRDLGTEGAGHADVAIKRAIEEGIIPGPRLFMVTRAIVATGSYGPARAKFRPDCCFRKARRRRAASTKSCARCGIRRAMAPTGSRSMPITAPALAARRLRPFPSRN